jgi:hypothetical protein
MDSQANDGSDASSNPDQRLSHISLEASSDFTAGRTFSMAPLPVSDGLFVPLPAARDHDVKRPIQLAVAEPGQAVADG